MEYIKIKGTYSDIMHYYQINHTDMLSWHFSAHSKVWLEKDYLALETYREGYPSRWSKINKLPNFLPQNPFIKSQSIGNKLYRIY